MPKEPTEVLSMSQSLDILRRFEYFRDGTIRRYPEEQDFDGAIKCLEKIFDILSDSETLARLIEVYKNTKGA